MFSREGEDGEARESVTSGVRSLWREEEMEPVRQRPGFRTGKRM